jgi:hypothetical protein
MSIRVSYMTVAVLAREGDQRAIQLLREWDEVQNPQFAEMEVYMYEDGSFQMYPPYNRTKTLPGIPLPSVIITEDDGEIS